MTVSVDQIIAFENGDLSDRQIVELFATLIESGLAWTLQGSYGRTAAHLIEEGWISPKGVITPDLDERLAAIA